MLLVVLGPFGCLAFTWYLVSEKFFLSLSICLQTGLKKYLIWQFCVCMGGSSCSTFWTRNSPLCVSNYRDSGDWALYYLLWLLNHNCMFWETISAWRSHLQSRNESAPHALVVHRNFRVTPVWLPLSTSLLSVLTFVQVVSGHGDVTVRGPPRVSVPGKHFQFWNKINCPVKLSSTSP